MKVLMLSWEYPPQKVGGLAQHVYDLTRFLARRRSEIHLFTGGGAVAPAYEQVEGVHVHRITPHNVSATDFAAGVVQFNVALLERVMAQFQGPEGFDIVHGHDWLVAYAAKAIKHAWRLPLVATIHATEWGRNNGLHNALQRHISDVEWWLTYEAWRVICCSRYMEGEVNRIFQVPDDKIVVIPNGVERQRFAVVQETLRREDYAAPDETIVFCAGRLVREKGVQVLLSAAPRIFAGHYRAKLIIAGSGPFEPELRRLAAQLGIAHHVYFTGHVDEPKLKQFLHWAAVAVYPSLYEPFGIVALEAMAAQTPVVVSDTGGLSEIVRHGVDGLKFYPGNSDSLADTVLALLNNPSLGHRLTQEAHRRLAKDFNWEVLAGRTEEVYHEVVAESQKKAWQGKPRSRFGLEKLLSGQGHGYWSRAEGS
ncbi:MAG TPA: glycosyltransferase family 4 protein [Spirochaetia bacterium]|nr:glycosyltransferase family 4 protein [Spirochaetia bacterium]